jgi:hypothetical protein
VFDAQDPSNVSTPVVFDPTGKCPAFVVNPKIARRALDKQRADEVEYSQLVKDNVPVAPVYSGLDGGMNKVFLARLPGRIIPLAIVLLSGTLDLPQMPAVPFVDKNGSVANKFFGALVLSKSSSQTQIASTDSTTQEGGVNSATKATITPKTNSTPAD